MPPHSNSTSTLSATPAPIGDGMLEVLPAAVLLLDARGHVSFANSAARGWLGQPLLGISWREVCSRDFSTNVDGNDLRACDGRLVNLSTQPLSDRPGQIVLLADVSEARAMQRLAERNLRLAGMGEMLARLSHQIRTPLSAAILYTSQLENADFPASQRARANGKVLSRLRHMEHMVRDMLMFAHGAQFRLEPLSIADLLADIEQQLEPHLATAAASLGCHCSSALQLNGNRVGLLAALQNLCLNAMENSPRGVQLTIHAEADSDANIQLTVADNGPGIPEAQREKILQPFFTTRSDGTGLGLPVVRSVVESHGGTLAIEDNLGGGALFRLCFPAAARASDDIAQCA